MPRIKKNTNINETANQTMSIVETNNDNEMNETNTIIATPNIQQETQPVLKKRGRKPKQKENVETEDEKEKTITNEETENNGSNIKTSSDSEKEKNDDNETNVEEKIIKKRGRKPKGGKIIEQSTSANNLIEAKTNVILHLKCSIKDLNANLFGTNIESFTFGLKSNIGSNCEMINSSSTHLDSLNTNSKSSLSSNLNMQIQHNDTHEQISHNNNINNNDFECETKDIWKKLKQLEHNLHMNNISDKRSACFWCTYDFDNPPVYIPKHHIKDSYHVYGCFCSPECAAAYLMEENIDSSSKFERYYLLNHIYSKIYNYTKEIKPSPNPYYMLDKYYGNLTIQEYRALLRNERLFLIVDKPLTRILPELHEDNDDFIINNKIIPSNTYQIKKNTQKKNSSKSDIIHEKFGFS